ncbi:hypothetical protein BDQ17DRAFT_1247230, partial [Cyathus striatus]
HAQACNAVEWIFGVYKCHFQILKLPVEYLLEMQAKFVATLGALHNFMEDCEPTEETDDESENEEDSNIQNNNHPPEVTGISDTEHNHASQWRDEMAQKMWDDYQAELKQRENM